MERYWCLRWFAQEWQQQRAKQVEAIVMKEDLLRLVDIPLVIRLAGLPAMQRGSRVKLDVIGWDEVSLSFEARFLELLSSPDSTAVADEEEDEELNDELINQTTEIESEQLEVENEIDAAIDQGSSENPAQTE